MNFFFNSSLPRLFQNFSFWKSFLGFIGKICFKDDFSRAFFKANRVLEKALLILLCLLVKPVFAQPAGDEMEALRNISAVTVAQAAHFILEAAGVLVTKNSGDAFDFVRQQKWLPGRAAPDDSVRLDHTALLLMRSFKMQGGIMYSIFKSPRYAYRELVYLNVIQGQTTPAMNVSGGQMLFLVNRLFALHDAGDLIITTGDARAVIIEEH